METEFSNELKIGLFFATYILFKEDDSNDDDDIKSRYWDVISVPKS